MANITKREDRKPKTTFENVKDMLVNLDRDPVIGCNPKVEQKKKKTKKGG